jgi:subtilisin family serine protease
MWCNFRSWYRSNSFQLLFNVILGDFLNVIGVGASDVEDRLARFSSRGPGPYKENEESSKQLVFNTREAIYARQKPDFTAPGVRVLSASARQIDGYETMSGTSM